MSKSSTSVSSYSNDRFQNFAFKIRRQKVKSIWYVRRRTRGEFNNASARRALVDWYLCLFIMCKAGHQYNERPRALALLNLPLDWWPCLILRKIRTALRLLPQTSEVIACLCFVVVVVLLRYLHFFAGVGGWGVVEYWSFLSLHVQRLW